MEHIKAFNQSIAQYGVKYITILKDKKKTLFFFVLYSTKTSPYAITIFQLNAPPCHIKIQGITEIWDQLNVMLSTANTIVFYNKLIIYYSLDFCSFPTFPHTLRLQNVATSPTEISCIKFHPLQNDDQLFVLWKGMLSISVYELKETALPISTIWLPCIGFTTFCWSTYHSTNPLIVYGAKYGFYMYEDECLQ
jgi:hypothetical protein